MSSDGKHAAMRAPVDAYRPGPLNACAICGQQVDDWTFHLKWWERLNLTPWKSRDDK